MNHWGERPKNITYYNIIPILIDSNTYKLNNKLKNKQIQLINSELM